MQKDSRKNEERLLPFETIKAAMEGDVDKNFAPKQNERDSSLWGIFFYICRVIIYRRIGQKMI